MKTQTNIKAGIGVNHNQTLVNAAAGVGVNKKAS